MAVHTSLHRQVFFLPQDVTLADTAVALRTLYPRLAVILVPENHPVWNTVDAGPSDGFRLVGILSELLDFWAVRGNGGMAYHAVGHGGQSCTSRRLSFGVTHRALQGKLFGVELVAEGNGLGNGFRHYDFCLAFLSRRDETESPTHTKANQNQTHSRHRGFAVMGTMAGFEQAVRLILAGTILSALSKAKGRRPWWEVEKTRLFPMMW